MTSRAPQGYERQQAPQQRNPLDGITGSFNDPNALGDALRRAQQSCNLVGPITVGALPMGCRVAMTAVLINPDPKGGDIYDVGMGKFALSKSAIDRIANAAGVETPVSICKEYAPNYCHWYVERSMYGLDGRPRRQSGTKILDLRPGSQYRKGLQAKAKARGKEPDSQVNEILNQLGGHAETKARLRADRALLGLRTYTADELRRPFVLASLMFTGESDDPATRAMFAQGIMNRMLGGSAALFGAQVQQQQAMAPPMMMGSGGGHTAPMLTAGPQGGYSAGALPPMGGDVDDIDEDGDNGDGGGDNGAPQDDGLASVEWAKVKSAGDFIVPMGNDKGKKISEIRDTSWIRGIFEKDVANPEKERFRGATLSKLKAIYDLMRRQGEVTPMDAPPPQQASAAAQGQQAPQSHGGGQQGLPIDDMDPDNYDRTA